MADLPYIVFALQEKYTALCAVRLVVWCGGGLLTRIGKVPVAEPN